MWNDTDVPLAYLITFRCRGTWLHGDERGSIDRFNNTYASPFLPPNEKWQRYNQTVLKGKATYLTAKRRTAVERAIRDTCAHRTRHLFAVNVRTNHVHSVVAAGSAKTSSVIHAFKANATREMRQVRCWPHSYSPWVDKGSKRKLWNENSIALAVDYVLNGQGNALPDFD
jgi:REP element-mobilizing transposase RayT